ncbi:MAG: hypothetical protein JRI85_15655 [Deltaproteobacteria bacterium]|nr:hypothetical protein [Deltaproteobacteria bacterium]
MGFLGKRKIGLEETKHLSLEELAHQVIVEGRVFSADVKNYFENRIKNKKKRLQEFVSEELDRYHDESYETYSDIFPDDDSRGIDRALGISL